MRLAADSLFSNHLKREAKESCIPSLGNQLDCPTLSQIVIRHFSRLIYCSNKDMWRAANSWLNSVSHNYLVTLWNLIDILYILCVAARSLYCVTKSQHLLHIPLCPLPLPAAPSSHYCLNASFKCPAPVPYFLLNAYKIVQITWMCVAIIKKFQKLVSSLPVKLRNNLPSLWVLLSMNRVQLYFIFFVKEEALCNVDCRMCVYSVIGTSNCQFHIFAKHVS